MHIQVNSLDGRMVNARASFAGGLEYRPNLTQRCKRFATASTSMQVAVLPLALWRGDGHRNT